MDRRNTRGLTRKEVFWTPDIDYFNVPIMLDEEIIERPANQHTLTKRYSERAVDFIREHKDETFFLYLAHNLPHVPLFASEDFLGSSRRGLYGDVLSEIDHGVGQIINALKEEGIDKNTLVFFTSDNGPWLSYDDHGGSAGLLHDGKGTTWEGGMRVPAIFWWPGKIKPAVIEDIGSTLDIWTTASTLAGLDLPDDRIIDGKDLLPVLLNEKSSARDNMIYYRGTTIYAARKGAYKLHYITETAYQKDNNRIVHDQPLLFNLEVDPSEKYDISSENPEIIEEINKMVEEHKAGVKPVKDQLAGRK
jgi:arylsulfatase A-like enzyme